MVNLPFSQACENNKEPILNILSTAFKDTNLVLEVGSGTGQHALHFAQNLTHLRWQTSDLVENYHSINHRIDQYHGNNILRPVTLDLNLAWPEQLSLSGGVFDGIFTANTLHIVSWFLVQKFFTGVAQHLSDNGTLCIYGPFNYCGEFTSASNAQFDLWLKERDKNSGIRDFEAINALATSAGLSLLADHAMPANNRLLVFVKNNLKSTNN